jgi:hypothetical protein
MKAATDVSRISKEVTYSASSITVNTLTSFPVAVGYDNRALLEDIPLLCHGKIYYSIPLILWLIIDAESTINLGRVERKIFE